MNGPLLCNNNKNTQPTNVCCNSNLNTNSNEDLPSNQYPISNISSILHQPITIRKSEKLFEKDISPTCRSGEKQFRPSLQLSDFNVSSDFPKLSVTAEESVKFISSDEFIDLLLLNADTSPASLLVLDVRENRLYRILHVSESVSVSCHSKLMFKRAKSLIISLLNDYPEKKSIVLIDDNAISRPSKKQSNMLDLADIIKRHKEVLVIEDGFRCLQQRCADRGVASDFMKSSIEKCLIEKYSCSPTSKDVASLDVLEATVSEIQENLWLGNGRDAQDLKLLQRLGISHILNVTDTIPNYYADKMMPESSSSDDSFSNDYFPHCCIDYKRLPASDNNLQDLLQFFDQGHTFIDDALQSGGKVLVHCWAGVSRSATITAAYLIKKYGWSVDTALSTLRAKRQVVAPNFNFMGQLERFSKGLVGELRDAGLAAASSTPAIVATAFHF